MVFHEKGTSNPSSPAENGIDSNENSSSALDQAMAATLAAIEVPETQESMGIYLNSNSKHSSFYRNVFDLV